MKTKVKTVKKAQAPTKKVVSTPEHVEVKTPVDLDEKITITVSKGAIVLAIRVLGKLPHELARVPIGEFEAELKKRSK
jgi:hypothetical protein